MYKNLVKKRNNPIGSLISQSSSTGKLTSTENQMKKLLKNQFSSIPNILVLPSEQIRIQNTKSNFSTKVSEELKQNNNFEKITNESTICVISSKVTKEEPEISKIKKMTNGQLLDLLESKKILHHRLEVLLGDKTRAVQIRRMFFASKMSKEENNFDSIPYENYNYDKVYGVCCESVIGYVPIPVGIIGPLKMNEKEFFVPMATTEGCLVASAQRGLNALAVSGVSSHILSDGMTRAPVVEMPNATEATKLKFWIEENFGNIAKEFNSTSNYAVLNEIKTTIAGRKLFIRFKCFSGDAMGMNMVTKGVTQSLIYIKDNFPNMEVISVSGNYCTDKKPSAINWIEGRGKTVVSDCVVPSDVVKNVLKTTVDKLVRLNIDKNLIGSAMSGSIGGFNAHASNILTAIFIACGQDVAQNVESSNCITLMEKTENGDLYISCTMPSLEVGTVGGGTNLDAQSKCLDIIGVKGSDKSQPGLNSQTLAKVVCSTVMAGELSLMSALTTGDLMNSHLRLNRAK
jgi:hydroxymethylglutaryl-CoA reductase (NADPH)